MLVLVFSQGEAYGRRTTRNPHPSARMLHFPPDIARASSPPSPYYSAFHFFSFAFLTLNCPGEWTPASTVAAVLMSLSILIQFVSLWRSLQVKDDDAAEYAITLRWFLSSAVFLLASLAMAGFSISHIFNF